MNQQQPYIHNRGQQIREDFSKANAGIAQGFQALIDDKQKSYDFIVKQNEDVELIKKDLNMYNNDVITRKSNELLKDTASAIKANGKVDFAKMGEIRRKTAELATAKRNSELSVKAADEVIKLMAQNAPNMKDVTGTYAKIMGSLKDENNLLSPKNAYEEAMKQYRDGIDYIKVVQGRINEQAQRGTKFKDSYRNERGDLIDIEGIIPPGWKLDEKTKRPIPDEKIGPNGEKYNALDMFSQAVLSPEELEGYQKQVVGFAKMFNNNTADYLKELINGSFSNLVNFKVNKTKEELDKLTYQAEDSKQKAISGGIKNRPENIILERQRTTSEINKNNATGAAAISNANTNAGKLSVDKDRLDAQIKNDYYKKDTETTKPSGLFSTTAPSGTIYTYFKIDDEDVEVGVTKKGNVFLAGVDGKPIYDPKKVNKVLTQLPKEKGAALQSLINKQKGGKVSDFTPVSVDVNDIFKE